MFWNPSCTLLWVTCQRLRFSLRGAVFFFCPCALLTGGRLSENSSLQLNSPTFGCKPCLSKATPIF